MTQSIRLPAPAKLNLFLHITGRRADGYHLLQTIFQFLDICDFVTLQATENPEISLSNPIPGVADEDNLLYKAARLLQQDSGTTRGAIIGIEKNLPMGGGLGGGSSDAATVLVGLNRLWQLNYPMHTLAQLGLRLGADVPIFIHGKAAWAEGVGERIEAIEVAEPWYLVIAPGVEVSTAKIFSDKRLTRDCAIIKIRDFLEGRTTNVCEELVRQDYPEVAKALYFLDTTRPETRARMTGTGSCVFASYKDETSAQAALKLMPKQWQGFVTKGCNVSPLYA